MPDTARFGQVSCGDVVAHQLKTLPGAPASSSATISFKAKKANTGLIYLGHDANVTAATGYELDAKDAIDLDLVNPGKDIFIIQTVAADKLCWATVNA